MSDEKVFGTAAADSPVSRSDLERALRRLNLSDLDTRDLLLRLAAHVVELTEELARHHPEAKKNVADGLPQRLEQIRASDTRSLDHVWIESDIENKYEVAGADVPCGELIPICGARCCRFVFGLSTQDLDEGVIRWDYGRPYMIRQRQSDGKCVHNDPATGGCTVHTQRPTICRKYDCRNDKRIWIDFEKRIPAPLDAIPTPAVAELDLAERLRVRMNAETLEATSVRNAFAEREPRLGPPPDPTMAMRKPR